MFWWGYFVSVLTKRNFFTGVAQNKGFDASK